MHRISVAIKFAPDNVYTVKYTVRLSILARPVRTARSYKEPLGVEL